MTTTLLDNADTWTRAETIQREYDHLRSFNMSRPLALQTLAHAFNTSTHVIRKHAKDHK